MNMDLDAVREQMINQQVRTWDVLDPRVLDVLQNVRREQFVPERYRKLAFAETNIPLAHGEVMMTPQVEGRLLQALDLSPHDRVLEIGTGSGFLTACLARLAFQVSSVDIYDDLIDAAQRKLHDARIDNCELSRQDFFDMRADREFDAIAVTASIPAYDPGLEAWLRLGGRLFIIVGVPPLMEARLIRRLGIEECTRTSLFETVIPPLRNARLPPQFEF